MFAYLETQNVSIDQLKDHLVEMRVSEVTDMYRSLYLLNFFECCDATPCVQSEDHKCIDGHADHVHICDVCGESTLFSGVTASLEQQYVCLTPDCVFLSLLKYASIGIVELMKEKEECYMLDSSVESIEC